MAERSRETSVAGGKLRPCPNRPNCVCSLDKGRHFIEPFLFDDAPDAAFQRLKGVVAQWPRTRVVHDASDFLAVEATSVVFRFVDDVEFFLDRHARLIHVRSASRLGYYDFGVNRRRVEAIRQAFQEYPC